MKLICIFILVAIGSLFALELEVVSFTKDELDFTGSRYPVNDLNFNKCAVIKIESDVPASLLLKQSRKKVNKNKDGNYYFYVSYLETHLDFSSTSEKGYSPLFFKIPFSELGIDKLEKTAVYLMKIKTVGQLKEDIGDVHSLNINFNEEGVAISEGEKAAIVANSKTAQFRLMAGNYSFSFKKKGFETQTKNINLQGDQEVDITLKAGDSVIRFEAPAIISIESEPSGAVVELNGLKVGVTPYQGSHFAGEYTYALRLHSYYPVSKSFVLKSDESLTIPLEKLKPRFGYWQINSTPSGAIVFLDKKKIGKTPFARKKILSGEHYYKLQLDEYQIYDKYFTIEDGDDESFEIPLTPDFARLEIKSAPEKEAIVFIDEVAVGTTPYINERMPAGTYEIWLEKEFWNCPKESITIEPEKPVSKTLTLLKNFGTLKIIAEGSEIYINDKFVGNDIYDKNEKPGTYEVVAKKDKHIQAKESVVINIGQTKEITLSPTPQLGSVSVFAIDKRNVSKRINGAKVFIDDVLNKKKTPAVIQHLYGNYSLKLSHPDFLEQTKNIKIEDGKNTDISFYLDTYEGSMLAKQNFWKKQSLISFGTSALLFGGGFYCNKLMNDSNENYDNTLISTDANNYKQDSNNFENYRNYCYYSASGVIAYSIFSWLQSQWK